MFLGLSFALHRVILSSEVVLLLVNVCILFVVEVCIVFVHVCVCVCVCVCVRKVFFLHEFCPDVSIAMSRGSGIYWF